MSISAWEASPSSQEMGAQGLLLRSPQIQPGEDLQEDDTETLAFEANVLTKGSRLAFPTARQRRPEHRAWWDFTVSSGTSCTNQGLAS